MLLTPSAASHSPAQDLDRALVARIIDGDLTAFESLYERYGRIAFSVAFAICADRHAAEDAVQDAFLGAWRNCARYDASQATVKTWLIAIVHHRAIDVVRARRRAPTGELPEMVDTVPVQLTAPDVWPEVAARLEGDTIRLALGTLQPGSRSVLELAYFGGLTQAQIATLTRTPLGTVKSRVRRALELLRLAMEATRPPTVSVSGPRVPASPGSATERRS